MNDDPTIEQILATREALRHAVLREVEAGKMSKEEAEEMSLPGEFGPLETTPPDELYNPMERTYWTLPMALAWIISRDLEMVRIFDPEYANAKWQWFQTEKGWALKSLPVDNLFVVASFAWLREHSENQEFPEDHSSPTLTHMRAQNALLRALEASKVRATGIKKEGRVEIPPNAWPDYQFEPDCSVVIRRKYRTEYQSPMFHRDDVVRLSLDSKSAASEPEFGRVPSMLWRGFIKEYPRGNCREFNNQRDRRNALVNWYTLATGTEPEDWDDRSVSRYCEQLSPFIPQLRLR